MAVNIKMKRVNATGIPPYELDSRDGGNNSRGVLEQIWPTGIMATGDSGRSGGVRKHQSKRK